MANENWQLLGDKLRNYRPTVDADAAWQDVLNQLNTTGPQPLSLRHLLGWKVLELGILLLSVFAFGLSISGEAAPTDSENLIPPTTAWEDTAQPSVSALSSPATPVAPKIKPSDRPQGSAKRAVSPSPGRVTEPQPTTTVSAVGSRSRIADDRTREKPTTPARNEDAAPLKSKSSSASSAVIPRPWLRSTGPVDLLAVPLPQRLALRMSTVDPVVIARSAESTTSAPAPLTTSVQLEILGGFSQNSGPGMVPYFGLQLSYATGARGALLLGAAYQRVGDMNLHWHQAEYHKDFGYPTGNAVDRWLDSYGAWEYSLDYRQQIAGRLAVQTGVQLTILQERGLRERIQGSDFFLGSSRRSLVDRDFGLRLGLDYRLTRHLAVYGQYLYGLSDITPNHLYESQAVHRHGGLRVGLRLVPLK